MKKKVVRYSEAFKLQVVQEIEDGRFCTAHEARKWYGISGGDTVSGWLRKYGKEHLMRKVLRVESPDEKSELKRLKEENKQLKDALAWQSVHRLVEETYFELLCERVNVDPAAFKKKHAETASSAQSKKRSRNR